MTQESWNRTKILIKSLRQSIKFLGKFPPSGILPGSYLFAQHEMCVCKVWIYFTWNFCKFVPLNLPSLNCIRGEKGGRNSALKIILNAFDWFILHPTEIWDESSSVCFLSVGFSIARWKNIFIHFCHMLLETPHT